MNYPSGMQYQRALGLAADNAKRLATYSLMRNKQGRIYTNSGNYGTVFKMRDAAGGKTYAIKCFTREQAGREAAYRKISDALRGVRSPYLVEAEYLEDELYVDMGGGRAGWYPVLKMEWVEGETLGGYLRSAGKREREAIADRFELMLRWLLHQPFAHGDLKPDNIIVRSDGSLALLDYDGMFVPSMAGEAAREIGTKPYCHPQRETTKTFDAHIDDYPGVLIALLLRVIAAHPELEYDVLLQEADKPSFLTQFEPYTSDGRVAAALSAYHRVMPSGKIDASLLDMILSNGNDAEWQNNQGEKYYYGRGVEQDYAKAVEWFRKAAEQGDASGQYNLGCCYDEGHGVERDYAKAVEWYRKAAEQGKASGQNNLGYCYEHGHGVERDYAKAVEWFRKAAEQGDATAQYNLGLCYKNGRGVPQDYEKAVEWFRKAAQWYAAAQNELGCCFKFGHGVEQDYAKAVEWYRKAAHRNAGAQYNLGCCYQHGQGVEQDYAKAVEWYRKAAAQGNARAQNNLGYCYKYGHGIEQNYTKAVEWYRKAAAQGNEIAKSNLRNLGESY